MQRFFVPPEWLQRDPVVLSGATAHQVTRVLRMRPGDECLLLDDAGWAYRLVLEGFGPGQVTGRIVERLQPDTEPHISIWLHQALLTERKMDWVLQKGTELGVAVFAPIATERSVRGHRDAVDEAKLDRWRRIVKEAAEQSGRALLPALRPPESFAAACARAAQDDAPACWPPSTPRRTRSARRWHRWRRLARASSGSLLVRREGSVPTRWKRRAARG